MNTQKPVGYVLSGEYVADDGSKTEYHHFSPIPLSNFEPVYTNNTVYNKPMPYEHIRALIYEVYGAEIKQISGKMVSLVRAVERYHGHI